MKNSKKSRILKQLAAISLAVILIFSFASCGKNKEGNNSKYKVVPSDKKVAILVAPEAQYPEDYRAAAELAKEYPDKVVVNEYADSRILKPGDAEIITLSKTVAADEEIGAIVYAKATQFTTYAINAAKEINPDIVTVCIEPEESIDKISELSDLVLCADWSAAASDIVAAAKEQGAKYFVVFSINRHIGDNPLISAENAAIEKACKEQGITYVYDSAVDPIYSTGISGAQKYIKESVARLYSNSKIEGSDVALFSTDSSVQSTLVEVANEKGLIYVCPSFPTAYNGIGEVYEIAVPDKAADVDAYIKSAKEAVGADAQGKARISLYKFPLASSLLKTAVYGAFEILSGTATAENLAERVSEIAAYSADSKNFAISVYDDAHANSFKAYCPGFEKIR